VPFPFRKYPLYFADKIGVGRSMRIVAESFLRPLTEFVCIVANAHRFFPSLPP
jgi:hypothetical protein